MLAKLPLLLPLILPAVAGPPVQGLTDQATPSTTPSPSATKEKQDKPGPPKLPQVGPGPILASDGQPIAPGRIPTGTAPEAVALWQTWLAAGRKAAQGNTVAPIQSFDMTFDAEFRMEADKAESSMSVRFLFLDEAQGYLRAEMLKSGRMTLRGPTGDWLYDKTWSPIKRGREHKQSVEELDRWVSIARNFTALTKPDAVRLVSLRSLKLTVDKANPRLVHFDNGSSFGLPYSDTHVKKAHGDLPEIAAQLRWIEVVSPDFQLFDSGERARNAPKNALVYRAILGLNPQGEAIIAQMSQVTLEKGAVSQIATRGGLFVYLPKWSEHRSGYVLPKQILTYRQMGGGSYETRPNLDLFLKSKKSRINPEGLNAQSAAWVPN